jgi:hypothetical protein
MCVTAAGVLLGLALGAATTAPVPLAAWQQPSDPAVKDPPRGNRTLTLTGCVEQGRTPTTFTLTDAQNGKYEVKGSRIGRYLGQRVEIAGRQDTARLKIKGGLYPSPNAAAQGGSMDPVRAAMEAMPGGPNSGTGDASLPTFNVRSVKTLGGGYG